MRHAVIGFLSVLFLVSLMGPASGQSPFSTPTPTPTPMPTPMPTATPAPCPQVTVRPLSTRQTRDGDRVRFMANIAGGDPKVVPTIIWSLSAGAITQGQSTRQIEVDTTGAGSTPDRSVKAEIWVGGYAPACLLQASSRISIIPPAVKLIEFGAVDDETLKKHLDQAAAYLVQLPDRIYLIAYAGRNSQRGYASNWLARATGLLNAKGLGHRRITVLDGGFREEPSLNLWIVPVGASPPVPTPTIKRGEIGNRPGRKP